MSGRWGDRPLGRGGWRVLQPEASPILPHVLLRSRAAERDTGANRPKPFYSGSRNQLPITVTILRSLLSRVDSPTGSFFSVLLADFDCLVLVPPYFRNFRAFLRRPIKLRLRMPITLSGLSLQESVCPRIMHPKRRSGRIAKELDIVLLGTDTTGKVFSEPTKTVVLSRHGAGIVSRYRFTPDEVLILRLPDSSKEAEVRLVGQIGGEPGRYIHGVAFVDPDPHFWPMEFPPAESFESGSQPLVLECSLCQERQNFEPHEIEEDVYSVNGNILRYCESCGTATPWKRAVTEALSAPGTVTSKTPAEMPGLAPSTLKREDLPARVASLAASLKQPRTASYVYASGVQESRYSGASALAEFSSLAEQQGPPEAASATAVLQPPEVTAAPPPGEATDNSPVKPEVNPALFLDANGRRINRRKHVRIRVNFSACVRQAAHTDEIVECENVSKGGVCFHSLQKYALNSVIEIAAPYSPGETALFVPAKIKRIEALSGGQVFRYGLEYMKSSPSSA